MFELLSLSSKNLHLLQNPYENAVNQHFKPITNLPQGTDARNREATESLHITTLYFILKNLL